MVEECVDNVREVKDRDKMGRDGLTVYATEMGQ